MDNIAIVNNQLFVSMLKTKA